MSWIAARSRSLVPFFAVLALAALPASAQTPDGLTPSEEEDCDLEPKGLRGLCNAYCEALDCDLAERADSNACKSVLANYRKKSDGADPPCGAAACPPPAPFFVTLAPGNQSIRVWVSNGDGTFTLSPDPVTSVVGDEVRFSAVGDFDGDGALDVPWFLLSTRERSLGRSCDGVWASEAAGTWTYGYSGGADLDNDGCTDLIGWDMACCYYYGPVSGPGMPYLGLTAMGECTGGFTEVYGSWDPSVVLGNWQSQRVYNLQDCDSDGNADLVFTTYASGGASTSNVYLATGNGDGTLADPVLVGTVPNQPQNFGDLGDVDGDGCTDWVGGPDDDGDKGAVFMLFGDCAGNFVGPVELVDVCDGCAGGGSGHGTGQSKLYDWDGDGDLDLLTAHVVDTSVSATILYWENLGGAVFGASTVVVPPSELAGVGFATPMRN